MALRVRKSSDASTADVASSTVAAAIPALTRTLLERAPSGRPGERARQVLAELVQLPPRRRVVELAGALISYERELVRAGSAPEAVHEALRALVHDRHPELLGDPALAHWLESPQRQAAMLSWLLRENVERLERLDREVAGHAGEAGRLRAELAKLRAEHETARRELERRRGLQDLGILAAGIVHDFNSVLQAIAGHASILKTHGTAEARESAERILDAARRGGELTRTLLAWVRHDHAQPVPVDVGATAAEVLDLLSPSAPRQVRTVRQLAPGLPLVLADPVELRRVVINLVVNSWQAIGDGPGELTVTTSAPEGRRGGVDLEVADDGRGMDRETLERVFEPFFSTRGDGTGLGLSTVDEIVQRMGGTIEVRSEPGRGARFRIGLPAIASG
jgi:signal transduction histidine kinase